MPVIFVTVEEALGDLAQLKRGERVLIHAAAGGVGLVAIQYAKYVGAEVFATAGAEELRLALAPEKHAYLRSLGVKYITSSRSGNKFEADMKNFLEQEDAEGVDVILNSLSHDDYISRSLSFLKTGGRFIEIGKRGIWSHQCFGSKETGYDGVEQAQPDVQGGRDSHSERWHRCPGNCSLTEAQTLHPLCTLQTCSEPCSAPCCKVTAQFLVEEGAKCIALLSRGGRAPPEAWFTGRSCGVSCELRDACHISRVQGRWEWLQASAIEVTVKRGDVSEEDAVKAFAKDFAKGPCVSLLHLAGALADGMLPALDREMFLKSYGPKVHGLRHLLRHVKFEDSAQFVLFSSTSSLFGAPGTWLCAASCSAEACSWQVAQDKATMPLRMPTWTPSLHFGPPKEAEVGMAVQKGTVQRAKASGIGPVLSNAWWALLTFDGRRELAAALSSMSSAERLEAIQQRVKRLADDVVGEELSRDDPLLE
eukprot:Skav234554  [mRNA]  locus=scaffold2556:444288:449022:+ [translate_table: standard]